MDDLRELLELLTSHSVDFLVVGAHALAHHGYPRATKDVDVWVRREMDNVERMAEALREFGANLGDGYRAFALENRKMVRLGVPPNMVDILNFAGEESFEEVWAGRVQGVLLGVSVHFPSRTALIKMKEAAGRPQDLVDVQRLKS